MKKSIDPKKKEEALKRRAALKDLSSSLQTLSKQGLFPEFPTVNGLLRYYYQSKGYTDLKTLKYVIIINEANNKRVLKV